MKDLLIILFWMALGGVSAYYAKERGRNPYVWFFVGLIFGILGLILLFILPKRGIQDFAKKKEPVEESIDILPVQKETPAYQKKFWYYLDENNNQCGPMSFEKLKTFFQEGKITSSTYTWYEELEQWKPLKEIVVMDDLNV